jgi:hypothetical protein
MGHQVICALFLRLARHKGVKGPPVYDYGLRFRALKPQRLRGGWENNGAVEFF